MSANSPMVHFGAAGSRVLVASLPCSCSVKAATDLLGLHSKLYLKTRWWARFAPQAPVCHPLVWRMPQFPLRGARGLEDSSTDTSQ